MATINGTTGNDTLTGTVDADILYGFEGNDWLDGRVGADTLMGGLGNDTYVVDSSGDRITENAGEGTDTVQTNLAYTLGDNLENLLLTGSAAINGTGNGADNALTGNAGANQLVGLAGNDLLIGGGGVDTLLGGMGNDTYQIDARDDLLVENTGEGTDTVRSLISYELPTNIENLILTGTVGLEGIGNALNNSLVGNSGNNALTGYAGNDSLDGGAGADTMEGGQGNDSYKVDNAGDAVFEMIGEGVDTVYATVNYTLGEDVENLVISGTAALNGTGNYFENKLTGNTAANRLDGGLGVDTLVGGAGNDTYIVDELNDVVVENATEGVDLIQSSLSWTLGANIENLTLTGAGSINGTGNTANNALTGNTSNNLLDGKTGADTMTGGAGNDTYIVDNAGDKAIEAASGGTDLVRASVTYTLGANVENLELTGTGALSGTGNGLNNRLTGNGNANLLDGGAGTDTLVGGFGNDTYVVDNNGDLIDELFGSGSDLVKASVSYTLGTGVENLTLTGTATLNGTGNQLDNVLTGNSAANLLDGSFGNDFIDGGAGIDTLVGGVGDDTYAIDQVGDIIQEFADGGIDTVRSFIGYTLGSELENVVLQGTAAVNGTGNTSDNSLTGNGAKNALYGLDGNDFLDGGAGVDTLVGGNGDDTYNVDNTSDVVVENLGEGIDSVFSTVSYTLSAVLENLTLTGTTAVAAIGNEADNIIVGNSLANQIEGGGGNDSMDGGAGVDTLTGGLGDDTYWVDNPSDVIVEKSTQVVDPELGTSQDIEEGVDAVYASTNYTLGSHLERLFLTGEAVSGTGNDLDNYLMGNALANALSGEAGNDFLDGGAGADTLNGGAGSDIYMVDDGLDVIIETSGGDYDSVYSQVSYTLIAHVEDLNLTFGDIDGAGNASDNKIIGTDGINRLDGGEGNDYLSGMNGVDTLAGGAGDDLLDGGMGADVLVGGSGNDTYQVDEADDTVVELDGQGTDTVLAWYSYTLGAGIENLVLNGEEAINGLGNALANSITGSSNGNFIDGSTGADTLEGGEGDDTYVVDQAGDVVIEAKNSGLDQVNSGISYTLGSGLENLVLSGTLALNGTGNEAANTLTGNAGANRLDGGTGADTLLGGAGDDTYGIDNSGDVVIENAGEGTDTIRTTMTYTLGSTLENLVLLGTSAINGTGTTDANTLTGNAVANVLTGLAGNDFLDGAAGADTLVGGLGNDTYVLDSAGDVITENANGGTDTVRSAVSYVLGNNLENLVLLGTSAINGTGNSQANTLTGNAAANLLDGGTGVDTLVGGFGNDTYVLDNIGDVVTENLNEGTDTVRAAFAYTLGSNFEILVLTGTAAINGTGNATNNTLSGNVGNNVLTGLAGNDSLDGAAGADTLVGGVGNDTYVIDTVADLVTENAGEGTDTVNAGISYTLAANVENLVLTGTASLSGTGNGLANTVTGNTAANLLDGGAGTDTLVGGLGNDTYVVDTVSDVVSENVGAGTDTVWASITYSLGGNLENLVLTGTSAINGTGNANDNTLVGNAAANTLTSLGGNDSLDGGAGADTLVGGLGNDTYVVDNVADVVTENPNEGTDTIQTLITYTLGASVENLVLSGTAAIQGTGNILANTLIGNAGANRLTGLAGNDSLDGGAGGDTLVGGVGNDTYVVDAAADVVTENANEGTDTIQSLITYTLGANLDNLVLTGAAALNGIGNGLANTLTGNGAANLLDGGAGADTLVGNLGNDTLIGGAGQDKLSGGSGADLWKFIAITDSGLGTTADVIADFSAQDGDQIDLSTIDANVGLAGDQAFTFIGTAAFTGAGQLRFENGILQLNSDGNLTADAEIQLLGVSTLQAANLIL